MNTISGFFSFIKSDKQLTAGCMGIALLLFVCAAAPILTTYSPVYYGPDILAAPGERGHLLGTNQLGQDIFSIIIYGTRTSLTVAVVSAFISSVLGILIGGLGGYFGGIVDRIVAELINVFSMLPTLFLILLVVSMFGSSIINVMIVIGLTSWHNNAKLMRAQALSLRERTFVSSAKALGETNMQILFKYIIPNGIFPVLANTTLTMGYAIMYEATLSFLGLGDPTVISWGQMINSGRNFITSAWWITTFGGLAIFVTILIFYLTGDGLSHVLNPKRAKGGAARE